jgi:hypothetical protein
MKQQKELEFGQMTDCCYLASIDGMYEIDHNDSTGYWDSFYRGEFIAQSDSLALAKESCRYYFNNNLD